LGVRCPRTLTIQVRKGGWSLTPRWVRGKSELHRARVPGESRGDVFGRRQSRLARDTSRESNRDHAAGKPSGVKRVILPAAISDSAAMRWLAQAGSREQPRR